MAGLVEGEKKRETWMVQTVNVKPGRGLRVMLGSRWEARYMPEGGRSAAGKPDRT